MSNAESVHTDDTPALPPAAAFDALMNLVALINNPKAYAAKVAELQNQIAALGVAESSAAKVIAALDVERTKIAAEWAELRARQVKLASDEGHLAHEREIFEAERPWRPSRLEIVGIGTLTREREVPPAAIPPTAFRQSGEERRSARVMNSRTGLAREVE